MSNPLIETRDLKKYFNTPKGLLHAVDGVSLKIAKGETLGVVGESGCGKSTLGRTLLQLLPATDGKIYYDGEDVANFTGEKRKALYKNMQMIFQDPFASLNPRLSISDIIMEPMKVCKIAKNKSEMKEKLHNIMEVCGLPEQYLNTYPHELDGGRRQRVGIARALALDPSFIVCDEPVSALDVSIQAQILNLLMDLQKEKDLSYMFITHDLYVVKHISHYIMVMYMGVVVEYAQRDELFSNYLHPYTEALLSAIPKIDLNQKNKKKVLLKGEISNPVNPPAGCRFAPRCLRFCEVCLEPQKLREIRPNHFVACCNA